MADRLVHTHTHDPSQSPALHFQEYILSSRRSSGLSTRSRAKRFTGAKHRAGETPSTTPAHDTAAAAAAAEREGQAVLEPLFPRRNQYFVARCDEDLSAASRRRAAAAAAAAAAVEEPPPRGQRIRHGQRAARRGALCLKTWRLPGGNDTLHDELAVVVESVVGNREVSRLVYTPPCDPSGDNQFTHALSQPPHAAFGGSPAEDAGRCFAIAYVSAADEPLQFFVRLPGGRTITSQRDIAMPKVAWKWRRREHVRVFAVEPMPARQRRGGGGSGGGGGGGRANSTSGDQTFAFVACEHDQLW